jgi:hypothetical protein
LKRLRERNTPLKVALGPAVKWCDDEKAAVVRDYSADGFWTP